MKNVRFTLDKRNEDKQNDFLNGAFQYHAAINDRMKTICEDEEKKFYRGEDSMIEKCNLSCVTAQAERQIVLYVSVRRTVVKIII